MKSIYKTYILLKWRLEKADRFYISDAIDAYFEAYFLKHHKKFDLDKFKRKLYESKISEDWFTLYNINSSLQSMDKKSIEDQKKYFMKIDFLKRNLYSNVYKILKEFGYCTNSNEQRNKFEIENVWIFDPSKAEKNNHNKKRDFYIERCETLIKNLKENFKSIDNSMPDNDRFLVKVNSMENISKLSIEFEYDKEKADRLMPLNIIFTSKEHNFKWVETIYIAKKCVMMQKIAPYEHEIFNDAFLSQTEYFDFISEKITKVFSSFIANK